MEDILLKIYPKPNLLRNLNYTFLEVFHTQTQTNKFKKKFVWKFAIVLSDLTLGLHTEFHNSLLGF